MTNNVAKFQNTTTLCTKLSDFLKLVITVLKVKHIKANTKIISYRDYKNFDPNDFNNNLENIYIQTRLCILVFVHVLPTCFVYLYGFGRTVSEILNYHAPFKNKLIRENYKSYISKCLRKAIKKRSKLEKNYFEKKDRVYVKEI